MLTRRLDEADAFAASLKDAIARVRVEDERMPSVSVGYAVANAACTDFEAVIEAADKAMYESKRQEKLAVQEMQVPELLRPYYREFLEKCMELSKNYQKEVQIEL